MELWAQGFNAWNQLEFEKEPAHNPRDLDEFQCLLVDESIEVLRTSLSATLVRTISGLRVAGCPDEFFSLCLEKQDSLPQVAIAGNGQIAEFTPENINQYNSLRHIPKKKEDAFEELETIKQLVASETSFTALSSTGKVYTWGDARYEACLGREVTAEYPASKPSLVQDLIDLPDDIEKVSSGGYATAALTSGNDVYFWGRSELFNGLLSGAPTPLDLHGQDFIDVAVGFNHIMVLTTERKVFVINEKLQDWKEVMVPLKNGRIVKSVHAGYKNSFLLVENIK